MMTPASQFNLNKYCYWAIKPPSEFTADLVLKVKIDKLYGTECYLNFGGSIMTAGSEKTCQEGQEYSFTYQSLDQVSNVYLIALATTNSAHIKFSYWAEPRWSLTYIILILTGGIVLLSLIVFGVFIFIIQCTIQFNLKDTIDTVKNTFTNTIEELEPGKIPPTMLPNMSDDNSLQAMSHTTPDRNGYPEDRF